MEDTNKHHYITCKIKKFKLPYIHNSQHLSYSLSSSNLDKKKSIFIEKSSNLIVTRIKFPMNHSESKKKTIGLISAKIQFKYTKKLSFF